jgi:excisionase family DNA binding protein
VVLPMKGVKAMNKTSFETTREWLSVSEVSKIIGVGEQTIRRWARTGRLKAYRVGGTVIRIKRADLNSFISSSEII